MQQRSATEGDDDGDYDGDYGGDYGGDCDDDADDNGEGDGGSNGGGGLGVRFADLSFTYPARRDAGPVLERVRLEIPAGARVGLSGASGCGKSTLFRLLSRLYDADDGVVSVGGVDVRDFAPQELRGAVVGVVPQETVILAGSMAENIRIGANRWWHRGGGGGGGRVGGRRDGSTLDSDGEDEEDDEDEDEDEDDEAAVLAAAEAAGLGELIARLPEGLHTEVGESGFQLSGGERQRVAIARLALSAPPVVLLDEFTSALDAATERRIIANLRPLLAGKTVVAIAHHPRTFEALGVDRIVALGPLGEVLHDDGHASGGGGRK